MSTIPDSFRAFVAERKGDDVVREARTLSPDDLPDGDVTVRVQWSSVNYKDGLATTPKGRVARISPLVPGVDLAGEVVATSAGDVAPGTQVIVHGYDLGVAHHGGFAQYARVPVGWVVPLPDGLTAREAMTIGTAGFTAALSVAQLEERGLRPGDGPVLVTGATGGVGSTAVGILANRGYDVAASTGKADAADWLRALGASEILAREDTSDDGAKPLLGERWAGAVDCVGGAILAWVLKTLRYGGAVAASGLTAGPQLDATVFPFILRNVALLGVDSVQTPLDVRRQTWERLATDLRPRGLDDQIASEITLDDLEQTLSTILRGGMRGRALVRLEA
jgi:acrylyl-CoA reductase (NADPH)